MSGNDAPPAPDYSPVLNAANAMAGKESGLGDQQMNWAQGAYNNNLGTTNQVVNNDLGTANNATGFANDIQQQYERTYMPLEDQFAQQAKDYASPENIQLQMGRAQADTAQAMDQGRQNALQNLESFGIDPSSTRYAALDANAQAQKGAAVAAAGNQARQNTVNTGLALEGQAIGQGEVMPSMVAGNNNTALQANAGAVNSGLATTASGASTMGTTPQYLGLASGNYGLQGQLLNNSYQNQLASFNANQNASSGIGSLLGAGLGAAAKFAPLLLAAKGGAVGEPDADDDRYQRQDYDKATSAPFVPHHIYALHGQDETGRQMQPHEAVAHFFRTGQHIGVFPSVAHANDHIQRQDYAKRYACGGAVYADGGDVDGTQGGQVTPGMSPSHGAVTDDGGDVDGTQGGQVTPGMSPSHGAVTDDVPARLNANEFVIPKDVALWKGQEFFQKLIKQSREAKVAAPAHPDYKPMQQGAVQ